MGTVTNRIGISVVLALLTVDTAWAYESQGHPLHIWPTTPFTHTALPANRGIHVEKSVTKDGYRVKIHLGRLRPADIQINIGTRGITLQSVRTSRFDRTQAHGYWYERRHSQFSRFIPVPKDADTELVSTDYSDGVLEILLPRRN